MHSTFTGTKLQLKVTSETHAILTRLTASRGKNQLCWDTCSHAYPQTWL